jgi:hypothetical protein
MLSYGVVVPLSGPHYDQEADVRTDPGAVSRDQ